MNTISGTFQFLFIYFLTFCPYVCPQHPPVSPAARHLQPNGAWAHSQRQEQPGPCSSRQRVPEVRGSFFLLHSECFRTISCLAVTQKNISFNSSSFFLLFVFSDWSKPFVFVKSSSLSQHVYLSGKKMSHKLCHFIDINILSAGLVTSSTVMGVLLFTGAQWDFKKQKRSGSIV